MGSPTSRLLALLEALQARPAVTGPELAERLGVDARTVRRYVVALQELGIPVEGQRGSGGGYRLRPGYRLPPLMLTGDEAVVVVLGLLGARRLGLDTESAAAEEALAKVFRVLPADLRRRAEALEHALGFTAEAVRGAPVAGEDALLLADAVRRRRRIRARYVSFTGEVSERELSPHGLVVHAGRWYLAAYDHGRGGLRTFRVDRMSRLGLEGAAEPPPEGFDAVAHVTASLARVPWTWEAEVLLHLPLGRARERLAHVLAELSAEGPGTLLRIRAESLDWLAGVLAGLECDLEIRRPDELRAALLRLAGRLTSSARAARGEPRPSSA
ncbi:MAG TPA: YafY family protein [Gaiellaceae bacterium]|nr:YafY family protein [Gaiellaceae bacterium]